MTNLEELIKANHSRKWVCYGKAVILNTDDPRDARKKTLSVYLAEPERIVCEELVRIHE